MIESISIPDSDVHLGRVGFGCARIFGGIEARASSVLLESALRAGISHFDTAPSYGNGRSEQVLGAVLANVPNITIATKIGIPRPPASGSRVSSDVLYRMLLRPTLSRIPGLKMHLLKIKGRIAAGKAHANYVSFRRRLEKSDVLRNLDASLKLLKRTSIDLYLIHEPEQFYIEDDVRELFIELKKNKVIRSFGLAFNSHRNQETDFGAVIQCRYDRDWEAQPSGNTVPIFHGVIRFGQEGREHWSNEQRPSTLLKRILETHDNSCVIFSASTSRQINSLMDDLRQ